VSAMGFLDRFSGFIDGFGISKDYNLNDKLISYYGGKNNIKDAYGEISKNTKMKFRETLDINDQILEKYSKNNKEDIQSELMKKYLKLSQDDLNKEAIEKEQIDKNLMEEEVDSTLKGVDKNTKDQIKKDLEQDRKEQKDKPTDSKDKKKELQTKIYEATYNRMYKDYATKVLKMKNAQFESMAIALGTNEAIEVIAMEKNLEKIDLLYHNHTGKNIEDVKKIKDKKQEFKSSFEYNQKGIESGTNDRARRINMLYAKREEEYKKYILALKDVTKTPQEKSLYKRAYQEANLDLLQNIPSLDEYTKDLEIQGENEKLAKEANIDKKSAINNRFDEKNQKNEKVTESKMAELVYDVKDTEKQRDKESFERASIQQKDALEKGDFSAAKNIGDAQRDKRVYDDNIEKVPEQATVSQTKKEIKEEELRSDANFFASLRKVNNIEDKTPEELKSIIEDRNDEIKDTIKENAYKEQVEQETEYQRYRKQNKKPNG
jgi:hypothetical protein